MLTMFNEHSQSHSHPHFLGAMMPSSWVCDAKRNYIITALSLHVRTSKVSLLTRLLSLYSWAHSPTMCNVDRSRWENGVHYLVIYDSHGRNYVSHGFVDGARIRAGKKLGF